jgi:hypothetical protein
MQSGCLKLIKSKKPAIELHMETLSETSKASVQTDLFITMALSAWNAQNSRITKLLDTLSEDQFLEETAPGRNRGTYLIGHLIAVSDGLLPLFALGQRLYPQFEKMFLTSPDRSVHETPSISELKKCWHEVNTTLTNHFSKMKIEDWFSRHTAVSPEDFEKEPHRNKLNVLINRTSHTSYHLGQLVYLIKKQG